MKPKLVKVKWIDIFSEGVWKTIDEAKEWAKENDGTCYTTGWLLEKNKKYIIIASTKDDDNGEVLFNDLSCIPINNVKKITLLNKKSENKNKKI